jgi:hypothetical protein
VFNLKDLTNEKIPVSSAIVAIIAAHADILTIFNGITTVSSARVVIVAVHLNVRAT